MGDGLLVEFASVVDALACAVAWQDGVAAQEAVVDDDTRLTFRIGINPGDVIVEGDDIHGDGVNIAARLEALAEPGGICLSGDAYRQAKGKLEAAFEDMGEQDLKTVAESRSGSTVSLPADPLRLRPRRKQRLQRSPTNHRSPCCRSKSSVAIQDRQVSAKAWRPISSLSFPVSGQSVVGRHESQSHDLEGATVQDVGRVLAVRYVLSGTIRRAGELGRITAELLEVGTGRPQWSERYDRPLDDLFAVQDEIARAIVGIVEPTLHRAEMDRISRSQAKDPKPHELMLRAWRLSDQGYEEGNHAAQRDCEEAIRLDPHYSDAHSQLAWIFWYGALNGWTDDSEGSLRQALEHAERGWLLNPKDYDALGARGAILIALGRYVAAGRIAEDLAKKFPGHAHATMYQGGNSESTWPA